MGLWVQTRQPILQNRRHVKMRPQCSDLRQQLGEKKSSQVFQGRRSRSRFSSSLDRDQNRDGKLKQSKMPANEPRGLEAVLVGAA